MDRGNHEIVVRKISKDQIDHEINSSAGLSCNGTVHEVPTGDATFKRIFLKPGEEMPLEFKRNIVKFADQTMAGLSKEDQRKMAKYIEELKIQIEKPDG